MRPRCFTHFTLYFPTCLMTRPRRRSESSRLESSGCPCFTSWSIWISSHRSTEEPDTTNFDASIRLRPLIKVICQHPASISVLVSRCQQSASFFAFSLSGLKYQGLRQYRAATHTADGGCLRVPAAFTYGGFCNKGNIFLPNGGLDLEGRLHRPGRASSTPSDPGPGPGTY